jgi:predicted RNase H-like HicB family nuclease
MNLTAEIRHEADSYWATVVELPGVFAWGDTLDELFSSLSEGIALYLDDGHDLGSLHVSTATLTDA